MTGGEDGSENDDARMAALDSKQGLVRVLGWVLFSGGPAAHVATAAPGSVVATMVGVWCFRGHVRIASYLRGCAVKSPLYYLAVFVFVPGGTLIAPILALTHWMRDPNRVVIHPRSRVYQTRNVKLEVVR